MAETKEKGPSTKEASEKSFQVAAPTISLPKGGGAIRGMGEKFAANPVTGTGSMTVPIAASPGRSGFGPNLSLSYDSGSGNGPFGFGWSLSLPSITRKTEKGLPRYQDAEESDVFILSGAEDLVPALEESCGNWHRQRFERAIDGRRYCIDRYRPRIEGLFARIERWTNLDDSTDICWRSISKDNITTWYGKTSESRIADPADSTRVFSWLICESYDDKGNAIRYQYQPEDSAGLDQCFPHEKNRTALGRSANRYLKRIQYGNCPSRLVQPDLNKLSWLFEVVFDYDEDHWQALPTQPGEHEYVHATLNSTHPWPSRQDPFSSYRAGFEVRTYRLCHRVLMFHHFPEELGVQDYLVRSTEFTYRQSPIASFLTAVTQSGYTRQPDGRYLRKSLPPLEFEYSQAIVHDEIKEIPAKSLENLPYGLDGSRYQWVDLDGEGASGILTEQGNAWFYKPNWGDGKFGPVETILLKPSLAALGSGRQQLLDLAGDGQLDVVQFGDAVPGFFERTPDQKWESFKTFAHLPELDWAQPNLEFVDLNGDGLADILVTEDEVMTWYPSLAEDGFGQAERVFKPHDEEAGPRLVMADGTQSIYLADMSGDGLTDLVRIRNGEVCYWPNLGYGKFGSKVTMDGSPWFDLPDLFDQRRIRVADIDGSGNTDIIYLHGEGVRLYFNRSGNGWSEPRTLTHFPQIDNLADVTTVDLLGNGTACLVWSSALPGNASRPMRFIDLMGGQKPHLLVLTVNNLGAETQVQYAPSTKFYFADKQSGKPWLTKLPFPVHVIERVTTYDHISRNRFVTRYTYHHGYFDGVEREFRGFGRVDQLDTEEFAALTQSGAFPIGDNIDAASHVPPVLTKTWFHTGIYLGRDRMSNFFAGLLDHDDVGEYYREPGLTDEQARALLLPDTILPDGLTPEEEREACRSLKGSMLRQEVYALDGSDKQEHPYTVSEQNFTVKCLQPEAGNRYAVFFTHPREALTYRYERNPVDPRVQHALTLEVDRFGNVLKQAAIGYGRRQPDPTLAPEDRNKQTQIFTTYNENAVTNAVETDDDYRAPLASETKTYEVTGVALASGQVRFSFEAMLAEGSGAIPILYEQNPTPNLHEKRLIEQVRTLYRHNDLTRSLPLGQLEALALPFESYKLAFTAGLLKQVYVRNGQDLLPNPADVLGGGGPDRGGYVDLDGNLHWWIPSGRMFLSRGSMDTPAQELAYARQHFFLPQRYCDPFHTETLSTEILVTFDTHDLLMTESQDALQNRVRAQNDYRVFAPKLMTDLNGNRSAVEFDILGMVAGTAVMGKEGETVGDRLDASFQTDLTQQQLDAFMAGPRQPASNQDEGEASPIVHDLLRTATTRFLYDLDRFMRIGEPPFAATLARETHVSDLRPGQRTKIQVSLSYSDGFGREIQKKVPAEPGPTPQRDANGKIIIGANGQPVMTANVASPRWVGSGWTVFNNKGKPVRQYEPFFTDRHTHEFETRIGVSPVLFYDPVERVVATLHPNHTWEKVVFDPWWQESWDVNDTVLEADPSADPDLSAFFQRLVQVEYVPTWHALRTEVAHAALFAAQYPDAAVRANETAAAKKTEVHGATPSVAYADSLGRSFLTVAHNRFVRNDSTVEEKYVTRVVLDIEGNQREIIDAKERAVMRYDYDMLGNRIHQTSMEAGERWMLNDVAGKPIYAWNSRGHRFRIEYDPLRRSVRAFVTGSGSDGSSQEILYERTLYGEAQGEAKNHRSRVYQVHDCAGVMTSEVYDFKGNLLHSSRRLAQDYKSTPDWAREPLLEEETFSSHTFYDALNRPITLTTPDKSVIQPTYNEANLLNALKVNLRGAESATALVNNVNYDAKGQREHIEIGNGTRTEYTYDEKTFRLTHLKTLRGHTALQDLSYTYDPAGNITHIRDEAQQIIYFRNKRVEPSTDYIYDAIYRLVQATGREHLGQGADTCSFGPTPTSHNDQPRVGLLYPGDGQAMGIYQELYEYDQVGNFLRLLHQGADPQHAGWTRMYQYNEPSLLDSNKHSNRLSGTRVGEVTEHYGYDVHGNMLDMPHLAEMTWNFKDQLQAVDLGGGGRAYYVYDASGQRVRKVQERNGGTIEERIYLGGFEIYRKRLAGEIKFERETLHVMDDKQRIALIETKTVDIASPLTLQPSRTRYQFGNQLGSVSLELDGTGQLISYEEYYPYGTTSYQAVRNGLEVSEKRYRYTGKERDEETGLYYHGARYYAPWLARWISSDPGGMVDGPNLYGYVRSNPIANTDPTGRECNPEIATCADSSIDPTIPNDSVSASSSEDPSTAVCYADEPTTSDPNDPSQYDNFEDFEANAVGPWTQEGLAAAWGERDWDPTDITITPPSSTPEPELAPEVTSETGADTETPVDDDSVGEPGLGESLIPIWGSGRESINHFQHGNYVRGVFWGAMAVSDVFLVKSLVVGGGKLLFRGGASVVAHAAPEVAAHAAPEVAAHAAPEVAAHTAPTVTAHTAANVTAHATATAAAGGGNVVYHSVVDGRTIYIGITNNLERRAAEHLAGKGIVIDAIPGLANLSRADARAVEQVLIEFHRLSKNGGTLINKINSIARTNPRYAAAIVRGRQILQQVGYPGF